MTIRKKEHSKLDLKKIKRKKYYKKNNPAIKKEITKFQ